MQIKVDRQYLPLILEGVKEGVLAVPRFQRDFVWNKKQIIDLFDSVLRGYPIGSLIFWEPKDKEFPIITNLEGVIVDDNKREKYILDGRQRITSLLSTLYKGGLYSNKIFVDLDSIQDSIDSLKIINRNCSDPKLNLLSLTEALDSFELVGYLEKLKSSNLKDSQKEEYANSAKRINKILMSYEISYISVLGGSIEEAVNVFSRLNSKGTPISTDYMLQAYAYSENDDMLLVEEINKMIASISQYGFSRISRDLVFKCIYNYTCDIFLDGKSDDLWKSADLKDENAKLKQREYLKRILLDVQNDVKKAAEFLYEECCVVDKSLLPYAYQFVLIALFFKNNKNASLKQKTELKKWFFFTTYSLFFTTKTLSDVRSTINRFKQFCNGSEPLAMIYNSIDNIEDISENVSLGSARFCAFVLSLIDKLKQETLVSDFESFELYTIPKTGLRRVGNVVCCFSKNDKSILSSVFNDDGEMQDYPQYFITTEMLSLYKRGKIEEFLKLRSDLLLDVERNFINKFSFTEGETVPQL